jgi:cytochrome c oxidase subunit 2
MSPESPESPHAPPAARQKGERVRSDLQLGAAVWAAVTLASLAIARFVIAEISFPTRGAEEAHLIDEAFMVLTYLAAPVFGIVIAAMVVAVGRHRTSGPDEDGAPIQGTGSVPVVWLAATSALALLLIIYPGLTGLIALRDHEQPGLQINVTGQMWQWTVEYPDARVRISGAQELVLPVDEHIQVNITSLDILHSFWVPAFRQKIDAVPGQTTVLNITPDRTGDPGDHAYRLQCAELCGLAHSHMVMPVRVVERAEFQSWLASQQQQAKARP